MVVDMEAAANSKYPSPHLKTVLKRYQMYAGNTLCGPSAVLSRLDTNGGQMMSSSSSSSNSSSPAAAGSHDHLEHPLSAKLEVTREDIEMKPMTTHSLLHQQLQQSAEKIRREMASVTGSKGGIIAVEQSLPPAHRSSFVPLRRVSDNVLEMSRHQTTLSDRNNTLISRSKSSPAAAVESSESAFKLPLYVKQPQQSHHLGRDTPVNLSPNAISSSSSSSSSSSLSSPSSALRSPVISRPHISHHRIIEYSAPLTGLIQPALLPPPIFSAPDKAWTEKVDTWLEGEKISCFVVGGEKRLCFPQILTTVLRGFLLPQINQVCDELQIFCSRCSAEQLEVLKASNTIPSTATSCGLITKTDAERLVNSLLHRDPPKAAISSTLLINKDPKSHFRVVHKCFGKCRGIVNLHLYDNPEALCIECTDCHGLFSPARFVAHSHRPTENRTCHWGFDTAHWRHYLLLSKDQPDRERWEETLKEFKAKFDQSSSRKETRASPISDDLDDDLDGIKAKKSRLSNGPEVVVSSVPLTRVSLSSAASSVRSLAIIPPPQSQQLQTPGFGTKLLGGSLPVGPYSPVDHVAGISQAEIERVKKMLLYRLDGDDGVEALQLLEKMTKKISSLEQICRSQAKFIQEVSQEMAGAVERGTTPTTPTSTTTGSGSAPSTPKDTTTTTNNNTTTGTGTTTSTSEAELHSLKKHLLRRHNECGKV